MRSLLNIGNSISLFFILLLISSIVIIFSFDKNVIYPYSNKNSIPKIEISNFIAYEIGSKSLISKLSGKNAKQFDDFEEITDVEFYRNDNNSFDVLKAHSAIKKDNIVYFNNGVNNKRNGYDLYSKVAIYHIDKKLLEGKDDFSIKSDFENVIGKNLYYDYKNGITKANNIKAILKPKIKE
ncbi:hypothetical protein [Helicobacter sp. MIT 14-3879]|uniref:hypothetical protein n=1 Tax=Helicobacter sp. MIT 14-3879 TaxID=2040649 RepID=UPI000E1F99E6|nr:hypothetical protein [Helicobacter sp. MIT 14-3879]RDU64720.1 hypothetical protein CQA44_03135 [Helicobacter sp. MIT 14-3879]